MNKSTAITILIILIVSGIIMPIIVGIVKAISALFLVAAVFAVSASIAGFVFYRNWHLMK